MSERTRPLLQRFTPTPTSGHPPLFHAGAGLPAKGPASPAPVPETPSLASQLLPGAPTAIPCRSRLAGEGARKPCVGSRNAFAGKPAPTRGTHRYSMQEPACRRRGPQTLRRFRKRLRWQASSYQGHPPLFHVGAGLPAKGPASPASVPETSSLASQLLPGAPTAIPCRSRLAGEGARKPCAGSGNAFAGKPAPTGVPARRFLGGERAPLPSSSRGACPYTRWPLRLQG